MFSSFHVGSSYVLGICTIVLNAAIKSIMNVEPLCTIELSDLGSVKLILHSVTIGFSNLLLAVSLLLPSAVDRLNGIGDKEYVNAKLKSIGLSYFAENVIKAANMSPFTSIVVFALFCSTTQDFVVLLNVLRLFLDIGS